MGLLEALIGGLITSLVGAGASAMSQPEPPKPPPPPRTRLGAMPSSENRMPRQRQNPYATAAGGGGVQMGDPGMVRLEAARSLRGGR